jgi:hypothetical protein
MRKIACAWEVFRLKASPAVFVGLVYAPGEKTAVKAAIKEFSHVAQTNAFIRLVGVVALLMAANTAAMSQAGSIGGTVGKTDKSISGDVEQSTSPKPPHERRPQKSEQGRRETSLPSHGPAKAPDATARCPLPEGSFSSAAATFGCALQQNVTTYAECLRYGRAHGYTQGQIDAYCPLLPR